MKRDITNIINVFNEYADSYQERFMDVGHYSNSLNLLVKSLPDNATVLDVACGPANISTYLLQQREELNITGTDLAPQMLKLAEANVPDGKFLLKDCRDFSWIDQKFDAIILGFCFPYVNKTEALKMIAEASHHLKENGFLYISTMEDKYENSCLKGPSTGDAEPIFMHYHENGYLKAEMEAKGFKIILQDQLPIEDESVIKDLILIGKLKE